MTMSEKERSRPTQQGDSFKRTSAIKNGRSLSQKTERNNSEDESFETDVGNAERLVHQHGQELRWTKAHGWLVWDSTRWKTDNSLEVERRAQAVARSIYTEA